MRKVESLLDSVTDLVRRADFSTLSDKVDRIAALAEELGTNKGRGLQQEIDYLRCLCLQSEIHDYWGRYKDAREAIEEQGKEALDAIPKVQGINDQIEERRFKQLVWTVIHLAHAEYRSRQFASAQRMLEACKGHLRRLGLTSAYGIGSRIAYGQARIARKLDDLESARNFYTEAIDLQYKRLDRKATENRHLDPAREQAYSNYMTAKCIGFGLGLIQMEAGQLLQAQTSLTTCRSLLRTTCDQFYKGYADLLYAQVLTARGEPDCLDEAVSILKRLKNETFRDHESFRVRSEIELARAYLLQEASESIEFATALLEKINGNHGVQESWRPSAKILLIRVGYLKKQFPEVFAFAERVCTEVDAKQYPSLFIAAHIEAAEAYLRADQTTVDTGEATNLERAQRHIALAHDAGKAGRGNSREIGICHLYRARLCVRKSDRDGALQEWEEWLKYSRTIENRFVLDLASRTKAQVLEIQTDFVIRDTESLHYESQNLELRRWLLEQAKKRLGRNFLKDAAGLLGISRQTLFNWRSELQDESIGTVRRLHKSKHSSTEET